MDPNGGAATWVTGACFGMLTVNSGLAIYRSVGDAGSVAFVVVAYAALVLLFLCLRAFERAPPGAAPREWLKRPVWALSTLLTVMFAWKVAAFMPWPVAAAVWALAAATSLGGFFAFFVYA